MDRSKPQALTPQKRSHEEMSQHSRSAYRLKILFPDGTARLLKIPDTMDAITVKDLASRAKKEHDRRGPNGHRSVNWNNAQLSFIDDRDYVFRNVLKLTNLEVNRVYNLRLDDGSQPAEIYENMWDLTPDTELLMELPEEYTFETALADLIDNSLQAVWSNAENEQRLISVEVGDDKISIVDTGPGMDSMSIEKWGKMGASLHRASKIGAIGGKPPYLKPAFGMFGYGGFVASMHLGRHTEVSSKTKNCKKVYMLRLERDALVSGSGSKRTWRTYGSLRDPMRDELLLSPSGSFTKVEIFEPKMRSIDIRRLQCKLKDIYFPYIQCDELSKKGRTIMPIEFEVNGEDLAEIPGGEVAITNLNSCNGPEFVLQLRFQLNHNDATLTSSQGPSDEANARLRCVYLPIKKGKESIQSILETLKEDGYEQREDYGSFSHVSCRRLGRLLPDARWAWLPFMDFRQRKGQVLKRSSLNTVIPETDAGFNPTPSKTNFAHQNPYTTALRNLGSKESLEKETGVHVEIRRDGKPLTLSQLDKQYQEWLLDVHDKYDEEVDCGFDEAVYIVNPIKTKELHTSKNVVRVHKALRWKGKSWKSGQRIKILKGACAGFHKTNVYATLEYILLEGFEGDAGAFSPFFFFKISVLFWFGRSIDTSEEDGCLLKTVEGNPIFDIRKSVSIHVNVIDSGKCLAVDDAEWNQQLRKQHQKSPSSIEILNRRQCRELGIEVSLPDEREVCAGDVSPCEIVAVIRPATYSSGTSSKYLDQKYVMKDIFEMSLAILYSGNEKLQGESNIYSALVTPSSRKDIHGLYVFQPKCKSHPLFHKAGMYTFTLSIKDQSCQKCVRKVQVKASPEARRWVPAKVPYHLRVGCKCEPISIEKFDKYDNQIPFIEVPAIVVEVKCTKGARVEVLECNPSTPADKSALVLELFDEYGNSLQEKQKVQLRVDGFCFHGGSSSLQKKVDAHGCIDLGGLLSVTAGYGKKGNFHTVSLSVSSDGEAIHKEWQIKKRQLRTASMIPESCLAGSKLEHLVFEVVNPNGDVDVNFNDEDRIGQSHTLVIKSQFAEIDESVKYAFRDGRCIVRAVPIPSEEGDFSFVVAHSHHLELQLTIKVRVEQPPEVNHDNISHELPVDMTPLHVKHLSTNENTLALPMDAQMDYRSQCHTPETNTSSIQDLYYDFESDLRSCLDFEKDLLDVIRDLGFRIGRHEDKIKQLECLKRAIESELSEFEGKNDVKSGSPAKSEIRARIERKTDTAASVVMEILKEDSLTVSNSIIGVVALLGTTPTLELSRIFAEYLGDQMLAVVCKAYKDARVLEMYKKNGRLDPEHALHMFATEIGKSVIGRYHVLCIEDISACTVEKDPEGKLLLPDPTLPNGTTPKGFLGYAVNLIDIDIDHLDTRTDSGCSLRETLFYRLFGEAQVYKTRKDMKKAIPCIKEGAVSLDGGILRGNGALSLGCWEPDIIFPIAAGGGGGRKDERATEVLERYTEMKLKAEETTRELSKERKCYECTMKKFKKKRGLLGLGWSWWCSGGDVELVAVMVFASGGDGGYDGGGGLMVAALVFVVVVVVWIVENIKFVNKQQQPRSSIASAASFEYQQQLVEVEMMPIRPNVLSVQVPPTMNYVGLNDSSNVARDGVENGTFSQAEPLVNPSKKLENDMLLLGKKIKHHEENIKYLRNNKNSFDGAITDMQVTLGNYHSSTQPKIENEDLSHMQSEEATVGNIMKHENSAAAIWVPAETSSQSGCSYEGRPWLLSEYLGLDNMLALVCMTYEGLKSLESYDKEGSINKNSGLHGLGASIGQTLEGRFNVICLEHVRPYVGEFMANDPQRRLALRKPALPNGESPAGFIGFAVNMIHIDSAHLCYLTTDGNGLRETLFYTLFSRLQVYKTRTDMMQALPCIFNGAISLDGGMIRSNGVYFLHTRKKEMDVKFAISPVASYLPETYEVEKQMKELKWKREKLMEDIQREEAMLAHVKYNFEVKKQEFLGFMAQSSPYTMPDHDQELTEPVLETTYPDPKQGSPEDIKIILKEPSAMSKK
ncbi:hypothetical protein OSB04_017057 [Centaurea solstitialis]|uniref:Uncharacterized protein n=1 Tax=Centaurea solstitialis TaxID=347529 RepID=A0AA38W943_9ASTR|nr:hypothetical protein OSB04_017057 [Centaurea solstitialis]